MFDDTEPTVFNCVRWQSHRSELMSTIGKITAANIVEVMIASRENWALVANYEDGFLRLKRIDLEAAVHVNLMA